MTWTQAPFLIWPWSANISQKHRHIPEMVRHLYHLHDSPCYSLPPPFAGREPSAVWLQNLRVVLAQLDKQFRHRVSHALTINWDQVDLALWTVTFSGLAKPHSRLLKSIPQPDWLYFVTDDGCETKTFFTKFLMFLMPKDIHFWSFLTSFYYIYQIQTVNP